MVDPVEHCMYMLGLPQPVVVKQPGSCLLLESETGHVYVSKHDEMVHS